MLGEIDPRPLQPETDALDRQVAGGRSGWSEVRTWCQRVSSLDEYFDPDVGEPIDLLVVAVDLDIAIGAGVTKRPANLTAYDATELCKIIKSWLPEPLPGRVVIAIPVMSTEAWILAAMFPRLTNLEAEVSPANVLVEKGKIQMGRNGPWKRASEYRVFAEVVANRLKRVRAECREANRFVNKLEAIAATLV
ncbi:MAG TPA: hypothetical protein VNO30_31710 [Kofleriaceae bacterium]|nr:hypothetical protein [Kofleriaceae bacterium]